MLESYWADLLDPKDPLINYRKKNWDLFESIGLPKPKQEAFQYLRKKLTLPKLSERGGSQDSKDGLVFVDGFFEENLSILPRGIVCLGMETAVRTYGLFLQNRLGISIGKEKDPFVALNGAFLGRGAFLYVPPKSKADLRLFNLYTCGEMASPRLHIYLGRESTVNFSMQSEGKSGFSNSVIDLVLDSGAKCRWMDRGEGDFHAIRATLKRDSTLKSVFLGNYLRTSVSMELAEENSEVEVLGLVQLKGDQEGHIHAHVEHIAPNARSRTHVKSVVRDQSRFSFEGKIYVHPEAEKTESYQLNNNLILSDEASANAKPNLEIFADDVKASHGATTGKLDDEELFYLRSRGLGLKEAREWLIEGFCREITDHAR